MKSYRLNNWISAYLKKLPIVGNKLRPRLIGIIVWGRTTWCTYQFIEWMARFDNIIQLYGIYQQRSSHLAIHLFHHRHHRCLLRPQSASNSTRRTVRLVLQSLPTLRTLWLPLRRQPWLICARDCLPQFSWSGGHSPRVPILLFEVDSQPTEGRHPHDIVQRIRVLEDSYLHHLRYRVHVLGYQNIPTRCYFALLHP